MKIATFGSWIGKENSYWTSTGVRGEFEAACRRIGQRIAECGHTLIVGSSRPHTADRHIAEGYFAECKSRQLSGSILVLRPSHACPEYAALDEGRPGYFRFIERRGLLPEGMKALAVRHADVVLTIGGAEGTYMAGLAAALGDKVMIPIGSFGGASKHLIEAIRELRGNTGLDSELDALNASWGDHIITVSFRMAGISPDERPIRLLLIHGRSTDWQELALWLRTTEIPVNPLIMINEFGDGRALPDKFEQLAGGVDGAIALATPDDMGGLASLPVGGLSTRARENVWIEYGWFWGRLGRNRVMLLHKGDVEMPTDLRGLEFYSYDTAPSDRSEQIREFLKRIRSGRPTAVR